MHKNENEAELLRKTKVKIIEPVGSLIKLRNPGFFAVDKHGVCCVYAYPCKILDNKKIFRGRSGKTLYFDEYVILLDNRLYTANGVWFAKILCQHYTGFLETCFLNIARSF